MSRYRTRYERHRPVLQLDVNGVPQSWMSLQDAALHYATDEVMWFDGDGPLATLRGGHNSVTGRQSIIEVHPIIAVRGSAKLNLFEIEPTITRRKIARRDRHTCAYCGDAFRELDLTLEHIVPRAQGGQDTWMNLVAACTECNARKGNRTPEQARMPLLFLPYVPSRFEDFLLQGRAVRADVHAWLKARLPKGSRLN